MGTLSYSQTVVQPWLTPVRLATAVAQTGTYYNGPTNDGVKATFTYSAGVLTIDGVTVEFGDRVLLKDQSSGLENGIYICTIEGAVGVAAVLERSSDFQCIEQMRLGFYASVCEGTANAGTIFTMVAPKPGAVGVDAINFSTLTAVKVSATEASNAVTASGQTGVITTSALTTAGAGSYAITWTNTEITTASVIQLTLMGGTNTVKNITLQATAGAGTSTLTIFNNTAATALNGTLLIGYTVS